MTRVVPIGLPGNGTVLDWTALKPQLSDTGHKPVVRQIQISGGYATPWSISLMLLIAGVKKAV